MVPCGRPSFKVLKGPMLPFTRTLSVQFMNKEDRGYIDIEDYL